MRKTTQKTDELNNILQAFFIALLIIVICSI